MSLAKRIAQRMVGKKLETAVAPARSQVHLGGPLPRPPTVPHQTDSARWRGSCKAIDADTGRACKLPAHPGEPDRHRHERGPFFRTVAPGQSIPTRERLDELATTRLTQESL